ncbi:MAG: carboxypeptidase regulatory-like domain-containing protein [Sandaracinaceae bacterium]|nr:carboxypeptidase regulatory-like domain-containing protein [Sandaracinaceae bacterium]
MVRARIGLPSESASGSPPEREAPTFFEACVDTLSRALSDLAGKVEPIALSCVLALGGCGPGPLVDVGGVVRDGRTGAPIAGAIVSTERGATAETDEAGRFTVPVEEGRGRRLTAEAPGRCPASETIDVSRARSAEVTIHLATRLEPPQDHVQVGFDSLVRLEARLRCDEDAALEWAQVGGPELGDERLRTEDRGRVATVRTHRLEELARLDDRVSVIALDRRQRGEYRLRLRARFGAQVEEHHVRVVAAPTSTGLYQVPTGADVHFNGGSGPSHEWTLASRPQNSEAELLDASTRTPTLRPDRFGTYVVEHQPSGVQMSLQAGAYDRVPRDCGREGCHVAEAEAWESTVHAQTFRRGITGALGAEFDERCWSCHATGVDFGIDNGGLHHTAARFGWAQPAPGAERWDEMPRRVRRHASVWCSACHGPGRIVPPQFRWQYGAKFDVGVCARCHDVDEDDADANHRSPHVDEWRLSPMARFVRGLDARDPAVRDECTQCHSAQGFVSWRRTGRVSGVDPLTVSAITCATCHDPHDATRPRGLRVDDTSDPIAGRPADDLGSGALCASCHRPAVAWSSEPSAAPHAAQAALLVGRGARTAPEMPDGAHRRIADTCTRCHMTRPAPDDPSYSFVGGHTFAVRARRGDGELSRAACSPCHGGVEPGAVGARDHNGDGRAGTVAEEHDASMASVTEALRRAIARAAIADGCTPARVAADVIDLDARLHLVDDAGRVLGDCDADGVLGESERPVLSAALPAALRDVAYDVALLRADGSRGVHNPAYTFSVFAAVAARLR